MRHENVREEQSDDDSYLVLASLYNVNYIGEKKPDNIGCFVPSYTRTQLSEEDDYFLFSIYIKNAKRHIAIINYFYQIILYSRLFNRVNCML